MTISSANSGSLKRTDGADVFNYSMKYGGSAVSLSGAGSTFNQSSAASVNVNKDLTITYAGVAAEAMVEGTYADTITLNIAAN